MSSKIPQHIAIIMDGNGRWAKERGLSRTEGHICGAKTIDTVVEEFRKIGVRYLTLYAFSEENWSRPSEEVSSLMALLHSYLLSKKQKMLDQGIRFHVIGDPSMLSKELRTEIASTIEATRRCDKMTLVVALSYGSRQEICRAVNKLMDKGISRVSIENISDALDTGGIPDPDLLIRTSGEYRMSNFLLWQMAYTEFYFTDTLWPDFGKGEIAKAIEEYQKRERRFGLVSEQL